MQAALLYLSHVTSIQSFLKHSSYYKPMNRLTTLFCFSPFSFSCHCALIEHNSGLFHSYSSATYFNCCQELTTEKLVSTGDSQACLFYLSSFILCIPLKILFFFVAWLPEKPLHPGDWCNPEKLFHAHLSMLTVVHLHHLLHHVYLISKYTVKSEIIIVTHFVSSNDISRYDKHKPHPHSLSSL